MKQKTSLNIKKRVLAGIAISALALATVAGAVNFGTNANAATGTDTTKAEYGEQLKDQSPASLTDATWGWYTGDKSGWTWVDAGTNYFGKPTGTRTLVAKNADGTAYDTVTFPVQRRNVTPLVKQGSASAYNTTSVANYVTDNSEASISTYKKTVTVTAGEGGTASGGGEYVIGQTATIEATPEDGYHFVKWNDEGSGNTDNPRTITVNGDVAYTATFEEESMKVTPALPTKFGDVSIMTLEEAVNAIGSSYSGTYTGSKYCIYGIADSNGTTGDTTGSTSSNLQDVGPNWFKRLNKPVREEDAWVLAGHTLFGGPLYLVRNYEFYWLYEKDINNKSSNTNYVCTSSSKFWGNGVVGSSIYVAIVCADGIIPDDTTGSTTQPDENPESTVPVISYVKTKNMMVNNETVTIDSYTTDVKISNLKSINGLIDTPVIVRNFKYMYSEINYLKNNWANWNGSEQILENAKYLAYIYTGSSEPGIRTLGSSALRPDFSPSSIDGTAYGWTCAGRYAGMSYDTSNSYYQLNVFGNTVVPNATDQYQISAMRSPEKYWIALVPIS